MNEVINGELSITLPDGFRAMAPDEVKSIYSTDVDTICGFRDEERHVIVVVTWNVSNRVAAKIASPRDIAKRVEKAQSRALKRNGYRKDGFFDAQAAGQRASGVRFGYTAEGIEHDAEAIVFIHGATCYILYCYSRSENAQRDAALRDELLASLSITA